MRDSGSCGWGMALLGIGQPGQGRQQAAAGAVSRRGLVAVVRQVSNEKKEKSPFRISTPFFGPRQKREDDEAEKAI